MSMSKRLRRGVKAILSLRVTLSWLVFNWVLEAEAETQPGGPLIKTKETHSPGSNFSLIASILDSKRHTWNPNALNFRDNSF